MDTGVCMYMHRVAAGDAFSENVVYARLSFLEPSMPPSAIQDVINQGTCHAALVSGELHYGELRGIVLQVIAPFGYLMVWLPLRWSAHPDMQMQHSCCLRHSVPAHDAA